MDVSPTSEDDNDPICISYSSVTICSDVERTAGYNAATSLSKLPLSYFNKRCIRPPNPIHICAQNNENNEKLDRFNTVLTSPSLFRFCISNNRPSALPNSLGTELSLTTSRKFLRVTGSFRRAKTRCKLHTRAAASEMAVLHLLAAAARFSRSLR